ncbi:TRAP transporter permease [Fodinicurvata sp. EGI_FJ10296]|uniref:TRAP transporter permease n=1 Tax=Fodinicurvata sp. EGI_FJ10296 TaxID=3231908 RepID=UPI0034527D75
MISAKMQDWLRSLSPVRQGVIENTRRGWIIAAIAFAMAAYHLWTGYFGTPPAQWHRTVHVAFLLSLCFLIYPFRVPGRMLGTTIDAILLTVAIAACGYILWDFDAFVRRAGRFTTTDLVAGGAIMVVVIEATRRAVGMIIPMLAMLGLLFTYFGQSMPGTFAHRGFSIDQIISFQALQLEGVFGTPIAVMSTYIVLFILFAAFLEVSRIGEFLTDLAFATTRRTRGGPAKATVLASAFVGSISGSGVANVATTGTFTIPLMKRAGYKPHMAGALEAAASNGGQIMPPVMAAAAFLMSENTGIPYVSIIGHATIPAALYFLSVLAAVHFIAVRDNLGIHAGDKTESALALLIRKGVLLSPIALLLTLLISGYTPMYACFAAIVMLIPVSWLKREHRLTPGRVVAAMIRGARQSVQIGVTCACAGIVIGAFTQTGVGFRFSSMIVNFSGGYLLFGLMIAMVTCIILGMGMPTSAAYILIASLGASALIDLGASQISAHMFILYFAVMSAITPPVALAAYAAAAIAGSGAQRTAVTACKLAIVAFIVPYMFVFHEELLFIGSAGGVAWAVMTAAIGACLIAAATFGCLIRPMSAAERLAAFVAAGALLYPGLATDMIGLTVGGGVVAWQYWRSSREAPSPVPQSNAP